MYIIVSILRELKKLYYNKKVSSIFKANDIRGIYPEELNEATVEKICTALAGYFGARAKLVIGRDARLSSPSLYRALKSGLKVESLKLKVIDAGLMTTPMLYFLVNKLNTDGGIMVTASHNPKQYNGLKIVQRRARPVGGKEIGKLVSLD